MGLFYHNLWHDRKPALEALREAQLWLYRHPGQVGKAAAARAAPDFTNLVEVPAQPGKPDSTSSPRLWAGFLLSGIGR
jgi:CHAT domain-containing protein